MFIPAKFDYQASLISEKITFACDDCDLKREDIADFKHRQWLRFVDSATFPMMVPCQVVIYCENFKTAKIVFFNNNFELPESVYQEPILNKTLIEKCEKN